ncbi:MAG TPA: alpha/beta hydrolase [Actinomycetota bacterium]|nr:alpha/beta hydrolase [Actinomycetota bacterium]
MKLDAQRKRAAVSGGEMAYVDAGDGPPVVLLHGFPTSSHLWRREAWLFAERMRVIAPDLLGYGESEKPLGADLSEEAQTRYVDELLGQLGIERAAVVGHDLGGGIAQMLALDGEVDVACLVLLDAVCFDAWPIEGVRMLQSGDPEQERPDFVEEILRLIFDTGIAHKDRLDRGGLAPFRAAWRDDPAAFFRAARAITGRGLAGREAELANLDVPTFVLWGEEDPFLPPELAERLGETIPGATVALLPGCSHFVTEEAPQTVGPLVYHFLRSQYLGDAPLSHGSAPVQVLFERPAGGDFDADSD